MNSSLSGKVILVTGASSGIGEATAIAAAEAGAKVVLAARRTDRLSALKAKLGGDTLSLTVDITDPVQASKMVTDAYGHFGRLDVLVNNAGVMLLAPALEAQVSDWKQMVDVNILGLLYATHAALPLMKEQGGGHIVNISSVAGRTTSPTSSVYNATKHAVGAFSDAIRKEVYKLNIRVSVIEPGLVATELRDHIPHPGVKASINEWADGLRQLQSEDIAAAIMYAITQPAHVGVNEILIRPADQEG